MQTTSGNHYVSGTWEHIFEDGKKAIRFCFDMESNALVHLDVEREYARRELVIGTGWSRTTRDRFEDVEDSLKHGNRDALDNPVEYGLSATPFPPAWAVKVPGKPNASCAEQLKEAAKRAKTIQAVLGMAADLSGIHSETGNEDWDSFYFQDDGSAADVNRVTRESNTSATLSGAMLYRTVKLTWTGCVSAVAPSASFTGDSSAPSR